MSPSPSPDRLSAPRRLLARLRERGVTGPRVVLVVSLAAGLGHLAYAAALEPSRFGLNYAVYRGTAEWVVAGEPLYAASPVGDPTLRYLYPPIVALAFVPLLAVGPTVGYVLFTAASLLVAAGLGIVLVRLVGPAGGQSPEDDGRVRGDGRARDDGLPRLDRWLIVAVAVASVYPMPSHVFGNVNVPMAAAFGASTLAAVRLGRTTGSDDDGAGDDASGDARRAVAAGGWLAVAALPKLFPAAFGAWLLARRAWRAAAAAVAGGAALAAASLAIFGVDAHVAYVTRALLPRRAGDAFVGGLPPGSEYVTLQRPLSRLFPGLDPTLFTLLAAALVVPLVGLAYAGAVWGRERRTGVDGAGDVATGGVEGARGTAWLVALHATVAGALVVLPSYPTYFVLLLVTLVPLCYRLPPGTPRTLFLAGAAVAPLTLRPAQIAAVLAPAPEALSRVTLAVVDPVLTFGSFRLYGVVATLVACGLYAVDRVR